MTSSGKSSEPRVYIITFTGHLDTRWSEWFEGFSVELLPNGNTRISGQVADQSYLHGILQKIRDINAELVSVIAVEEND